MATIKITIPGQPVPASRPRVTRWGVYYGKVYKTWMERASKAIPEGPGCLPGPLRVTTEAVFEKARTSKLEYPRADNDNLEKAAWDAITKAGGYWKDDNDIVENHTIKRFAEPDEEPGYYITIEQL